MKNLSPEEAVRILENMKVKFPVPRAAETQIKRNAALEMAIKALATDINVGDKDTISRKAAIDALMDALNDVGVLDAEDINTVFQMLPPAQPEQLGTNLAEVGTDCISRRAAIERAIKEHDFFRGAVTVSDKARRDELLNVMCWLGELPPAHPEPDQNGDLWITVPDIDKVTCIYVQESKSKFCRIFYEER